MPYLCNAEVMALLHDYSKKLSSGRRRFCGIGELTNEKSLRSASAGFLIELRGTASTYHGHPGESRDP
jgi:hypothetical protein